jgi:rhodanese-related sulfurtransferase
LISSFQNIIKAVEQLETRDLIADGSRDYTLPTINGKHSDLASITPGTMADVVAGKYSDKFGKVTIVDCRYPYEFESGHIRGAVNMYTKDEVYSLLTTSVTSEKAHVLIFHCEFSSERGPKMYRFLRSQDREMNKDHYPQLHFPEVYLLDGGYKAFFTAHKVDTSIIITTTMSYTNSSHIHVIVNCANIDSTSCLSYTKRSRQQK